LRPEELQPADFVRLSGAILAFERKEREKERVGRGAGRIKC